VIDQTWSEDMSWHGGSPGNYQGRDAFKRFTAANAAGAFADIDMHREIHELIAPRRQSRRPLHRQRHQHRPLPRQPPTGKHAEWLGIGISTIHDGRITEGWFAEDTLGMLIPLKAIALPALHPR
jgi:SnoaL-like polyketide cyclase